MEHRDVAWTTAMVDPQGSGLSGKIEGRPRCRQDYRDVARTTATVDPQGSGRSGKIEGRPRCRQDSGGGDRDGIPARQRPVGEDRGTGGRAAADRPTIIYYVSIVLRCKF